MHLKHFTACTRDLATRIFTIDLPNRATRRRYFQTPSGPRPDAVYYEPTPAQEAIQ